MQVDLGQVEATEVLEAVVVAMAANDYLDHGLEIMGEVTKMPRFDPPSFVRPNEYQGIAGLGGTLDRIF